MKISEPNLYLAPGWERVVYAKDQPEYLPLPVLRSRDHEVRVVSRWMPSPEERERIAHGEDVFVTVLTYGDPLQPQLVTIGGAPIYPISGFQEAVNMSKIAGLKPGGRTHSGLYFVQFPDGTLSTKAEDRAFISGQAFPVHSHVHYDIDPVDEDGQVVPPGDPRLVGFYVDSYVVDAKGDVDLNQTGDEKDHGCTPVAKINGDASWGVRCQAMVKDAAGVGQPVGAEIRLADLNAH